MQPGTCSARSRAASECCSCRLGDGVPERVCNYRAGGLGRVDIGHVQGTYGAESLMRRTAYCAQGCQPKECAVNGLAKGLQASGNLE